MKSRLITSLTVGCLALCSSLSATTRSVLFIGNSYIYTNSMPTMLQSYATAMGDTLIYDQSVPGGYTLEQHSTNATTISKIFSRRWDIVVLQEQSQLPSFPPGDVETMVYPYAHILDSMIKANDTCTQTMFMMTWGRQAGDRMNCPFYPVVCTYAGMQSRLRESYMQMAQDNNAVTLPVGAAWKVSIDSFPAINLFSSDSSHPAVAGSYLQTSVLYASIFHRAGLGCTYVAGLATGTATTLQRIADKVALDSISLWQQHGHYPYAGFTRTIAGSAATFASLSPIPVAHSWSFGDAGTDTAANPIHTYTSGGSYVVSHTVSNDCFTHTSSSTITIGGTTDLQNVASYAAIRIAQDQGGKITFILPAELKHSLMEVYDMQGRILHHIDCQGADPSVHLAPGIYLYRLYGAGHLPAYTGKIGVY